MSGLLPLQWDCKFPFPKGEGGNSQTRSSTSSGQKIWVYPILYRPQIVFRTPGRMTAGSNQNNCFWPPTNQDKKMSRLFEVQRRCDFSMMVFLLWNSIPPKIRKAIKTSFPESLVDGLGMRCLGFFSFLSMFWVLIEDQGFCVCHLIVNVVLIDF